MSEPIKHECGIALVRLLKPLEYYELKYGTWMYGLQKLYLLMEKQHNRGQDGAGVAALKLDLEPGNKYIYRQRSADPNPINDVFRKIYKTVQKVNKNRPSLLHDIDWVKKNIPFAAEMYLGHLRYGTFGKNSIEYVHPMIRQNNWKTRNLVLAGNFNLTNVDELFSILVNLGQFPKDYRDTVIMLENVGHFLDTENQRQFDKFKKEDFSNEEISHLIADNMNVKRILRESSKKWDGGYVIAGMIGHGDSFVCRDPWGIRPAFFYYDDEIAVVTSERPVIQTAFNVPGDKVCELDPGKAIIISKSGQIDLKRIRDPQEKRACSFERIYFSRGSDADIYKERKELGNLLTVPILKSIDYDIKNSVFSFIPNTSETAFYGMVEGITRYSVKKEVEKIKLLGKNPTDDEIENILTSRPRIEKVAIKDAKLRTFITQDAARDDLVAHVYDITYGTINKGIDNLVVIDDSIVRGTTLKKSIIKILDRLGPKKIVVASSSPQIRFPDCYGIDMAKLEDFIAFKATIELLKENGKDTVINDVYKKAKAQQGMPKEEIVNVVKDIYRPFTAEEISGKIAQMLRTKEIKADVQIVYQSIENLHAACPNHRGDWYFTGDYPTPGGNKVVNQAFVNYIEGRNERAY
jgi:amidophosphoribosyltransferase